MDTQDDKLNSAPVNPTAPAGARPAWDNVVEKFARDYLNDRRSERRWRVFFRLAWLVAAFALAYGMVKIGRAHV